MARILVADDNPMNLYLTIELLEMEGHTVLTAANGEEAVREARAGLPDLILMDLRMPVMDGVQALRRLRDEEATRSIPVVALTASAMKGAREKILAEGFDGYIEKPIEVGRFGKQIGRWLARA